MVFYLKVNRQQNYTFRNLQYWVDIIECCVDSRIYIVCDNADLEREIKEKISFGKTGFSFIESQKTSSELKYIIDNIAVPKWINAGYAHLTTFCHAKENEIAEFWNIDADDTCFCLKPARVYEMLKKVEEYANKNSIDIFSLDMWKTKEDLWSFGITYTKNPSYCIDEMLRHCKDDEFKNQSYRERNIDAYVNYLQTNSELNIKNFYFENLRFLHYSDDFFRRLLISGLYHWKAGKLCFPLLCYCIDMKEFGMLYIPDDVVKLDINMTDEESKQFFKESIIEKHILEEYEEKLRQV